jgi:hypothetical protein
MQRHRLFVREPFTRQLGARAIFLLTVLLAGCVDLDQVTALAKVADGAKASLPVIAADFKGSCDRQNLYVHLPPGPPPVPPPPKACVNGDDFEKLGNNLITEQNVLLDYFDALGKLASSSSAGFQKSVGTLSASFKDAGLSAAQQTMATSAGNLAAAISDMALQGYRKKKIADIVGKADKDVTILANGLADQVAPAAGTAVSATSYVSLLSNEGLLIDSYYAVPLAKDPNSLAAILVNRQWQDDVNQLNARMNAAQAYRKLMVSLAAAHWKLASDTKGGHFDIKTLGKDLGPDVVQIEEAVAALQKDLR